jgi:hypothetical protein
VLRRAAYKALTAVLLRLLSGWLAVGQQQLSEVCLKQQQHRGSSRLLGLQETLSCKYVVNIDKTLRLVNAFPGRSCQLHPASYVGFEHSAS